MLKRPVSQASCLGDIDAAAGLFQHGGVLVIGDARELRGRGPIREALAILCYREPGYLLATPAPRSAGS